MAWTPQFSDSFIGVTGTTLPAHNAAWSNDEGIQDINGNMVHAGGQCRSHVSTVLAANQAVEMAMYNTSDFNGVGCRYTSLSSGSNDANAYWVFWNSGTIYIYKMMSGFSLIASAPKVWSAGDILRIEATGTTTTNLQVSVNGSTAGCPSGSDSSSPFTSGSAAIRGISQTYGTNFAVYDDAGSTGWGPLLSDFHSRLIAAA